MNLGMALWRACRLLVLLLLLTVVGFAVWPADQKGQAGSEELAGVFQRKLLRFESALEQGTRHRGELSEAQLNAYFDYVLSEADGGAVGGVIMRLARINVSFTPEGFVVLISAKWGPVRLSYELTGIPQVSADGFSVEVLRVRLGHLPLSGMLGRRVAGQMAATFGGMERERAVLDHLSEFTLDAQRVFLTM